MLQTLNNSLIFVLGANVEGRAPVDFDKIVFGDLLSVEGADPLAISYALVKTVLTVHVSAWQNNLIFTLSADGAHHLLLPVLELQAHVRFV